MTLARLGGNHLDAGDRAAARRCWQQSLAILNDLDRPAADEIWERLRSLDPAA